MVVSDSGSNSSGDGLRVVHVTDGWAMGEISGCFAVVWRHQPTHEAFRMRNEQLQALTSRLPRKCALVEVVESTSKAPSDEVRRTAMQVFKQLGDQLSAIGFVLEGSEARSTLNRAILTGMTFFVRQLQPTKVFKRTVDVAEWTAARVQAGDPKFATELVTSLEQLRALIGKR